MMVKIKHRQVYHHLFYVQNHHEEGSIFSDIQHFALFKLCFCEWMGKQVKLTFFASKHCVYMAAGTYGHTANIQMIFWALFTLWSFTQTNVCY